MKNLIKLSLYSAFCILVGCATVQGLWQDPSFTYNAVRAEHIGIGGVTSNAVRLTSGRQSAYGNLLRNSLVRHFSGVQVMPVGDSVRALGAPRYRRMMRYYAQYGVIQDQYLNAFARHVHRMRYLAFARIINYKISRHRDEAQDFMQKSLEDINYYKTLNIQVEMVVYDLRKKRTVWSGSLSDSRQNKNTYKLPNMSRYKHESYQQEIINDLANMVLRNENRGRYRYPSTPSSNALLQNIFTGLAARFPEPVKK